MWYAQINESGVCVAITQPSEPLVGPQFVPIGESYQELHFWTWNGSEWLPPA